VESLNITGVEPLLISHLSKVTIGVQILLRDTSGNVVDLVGTNPPVKLAVVAAGTADPTASLVIATWHARLDDDGVLGAFADLTIGPGAATPWPGTLGDCDVWWNVITVTYSPLEKAPGRLVLT
jgi:hypothetical protein